MSILVARSGSVRAIAVLRIALGSITLLHLRPFLQDARRGVAYNDHFWEPFASWMPRPSGDVWVAMIWIGAVAASLMTLGLFSRVATAITFAVVTGNILLSQTHFGHNRTFLAILLGGVALLPSGRVLSIDALLERRAGRIPVDHVRLWPLWLLRGQVALVYLTSGLGKLVDPDWAGGLVLWDRVVRHQHVLDPWPVPSWMLDLLTSRWLYTGLASTIILTELFIAVGLWFARTRLTAVWAAIMFHLAIEITANVEVFSYAAVAALAIWVTPSTRDRTLLLRQDVASARVLIWTVRILDWFAGFRVEIAAPTDPPVTLIDRGGTVTTGAPAVLGVLTRLPATFFFAAPGQLARRASSSPASGGPSRSYFTKRL